jgi:predicted nucleic acid-binding Zn ribbon protein
MQKVNDTPLKKCPECGKPALQRLMSAPVFRLKGSGWYETDFKSDDENKRNLAEKPESEAEPAKATEAKDDKKDGGKEAAVPAVEKPAAAAGGTAAVDKVAKTADKPKPKSAVAKKPSRRGAPTARTKVKKPLKRAGAKR